MVLPAQSITSQITFTQFFTSIQLVTALPSVTNAPFLSHCKFLISYHFFSTISVDNSNQRFSLKKRPSEIMLSFLLKAVEGEVSTSVFQVLRKTGQNITSSKRPHNFQLLTPVFPTQPLMTPEVLCLSTLNDDINVTSLSKK